MSEMESGQPANNIHSHDVDHYRREHERLKLLLNVTRNIARELQLDRLLMLIMDEVINVLNCDRCTVFMLDKGQIRIMVAGRSRRKGNPLSKPYGDCRPRCLNR